MIKYGKIEFTRDSFSLSLSALTIDYKQRVAILGENGCGKSTFINLSCGLLGNYEIEFAGKQLKKMDSRERAKTFALFAQNPSMAFPFTVFEIVRMGRFAHNSGKYTQSDNDKTYEAMTLFDIVGHQKKKFHELSGGEQRRVMLARAFNQDTPYIFLDEPVSMLDIRHGLEIMNIIEDSGKTIVASMHDVNLSLRYFDRLIMMKNGRIIYDIIPKQINPEIIQEIYNVKISDNSHSFSFII